MTEPQSGSDPIKVHWYLPTAGDARRPRDGGTNISAPPSEVPGRFRPPTLDYLSQLAINLDRLGFDGVLTPTGSFCEESWVATAALLGVTKRLKFLIALNARYTQPAYTALQASTFQRLSQGRLLLNVVTAEPGAEALKFGEHLDKVQQYQRTGEFLAIVRAALAGGTVDFAGDFYEAQGLVLNDRLGEFDPPTIYFGGSSAPAGPVAASYADVYLSWLEPTDQLREKIDWIRGLAAERGRTVRFGVRSWILARETTAEALAAAQAQVTDFDEGYRDATLTRLRQRDSVGQQRTLDAALSADGEWLAPNLWGGYALVAGGPSLALVGGFSDLADRIEEYRELGISEFIFGGFPNFEESTWVGEGLLPELAARGLFEATERQAVAA